MIKRSTVGFFLAAILVHITLLLSLSDLYYTSDISSSPGNGKTPQFYPLRAPARRLVVIVADEVSSDMLFSATSEGATASPFLREIVTRKGRWGVLHSQPWTNGYQALFAGFTDNRGGWWREPSDKYDSLFKASRYTWYWGRHLTSQLDLLSTLVESGRSDVQVSSDASTEKGPSNLSISWITNNIEKLFGQSSKSNVTLAQLLSEDQIVFFVHFLAHPEVTPGSHDERPSSQISRDQLEQIDSAVKRITTLVDSYYGDHQTAYIFTSTGREKESGALFSNHVAEVSKLPFLCWGAGVKKPRSSQHGGYHYDDGLAEKWQLSRYERIDVKPMDVAPLMATLIGVHIPMDSEGTLPIDFIHYNKEFDANSMFANARQLTELVREKEDGIRSRSLPFLFRPFAKLTRPAQEEMRVLIEGHINQRKLQESVHLSKKLITLSKNALAYYQTYHQLGLKLSLSFGFLGWIMCTVTTLVKMTNHHDVKSQPFRVLFISPPGLALCCFLCLLQLYQGTPLLYCAYFCLPVICWDYVLTSKALLLSSLKVATQDPVKFFQSLLAGLVLVCSAEVIVLSSLLLEVFSVALVLLSLWPYIATDMLKRNLWVLCLVWTASCLCLALFPLLPKTFGVVPVALTGVAVVVACFCLLCRPHLRYMLTSPSSTVACSSLHPFTLQLILLSLSVAVNGLAAWGYTPNLVHILGCCMLLLTPSLLLLGPHSVLGRLLHIFLVFATLLLLVSASYEPLLISALAVCLVTWLKAEEVVATNQQKAASVWDGLLCSKRTEVVTLVPGEEGANSALSEDMRRMAFCALFGAYSLLAVVRMASPQDTVTFISSSSSILTGVILLLFKAGIPLLLVSCLYNVILCILSRSSKISALLCLIIVDIVGLNLFLLIQDDGNNWQETQNGIGRFVGAIGMILVIGVLFGLGRLMTGRSVVPRKIEEHSL